MDVGLIGVGLMGHGIARNVMRRGGFALTFMEHAGNQPVDEILELGATPVATPAAVAAASDVVILCVTGSPQVEAVLTGDDGVIAGLKHGTFVVDCSTALPESTGRMAALVEEAGGRFVDAPMTRLAKQAHEGTLNLLAGGEAADLDAVMSVLAAFTERVDHVGPVGAGHRMKLLHNFVSVGTMTLIAEAAAHAADAGVDAETFVAVLANGGGAGIALDRLTPFITTGDASNVPFSIGNAGKDIGYYIEMADAAGASCNVAQGVAAAIAEGGEGHTGGYVPELARLLCKAAD
ncbi:MAG: NAD(P)-dependent oxidoreductase [Minwuia sp.]|uniref:NAD(P)-dependent oxidoreductase n=1 Tax=Minwuia sp. TaxID=2493630 RepID=UPI003A882AC1